MLTPSNSELLLSLSNARVALLCSRLLFLGALARSPESPCPTLPRAFKLPAPALLRSSLPLLGALSRSPESHCPTISLASLHFIPLCQLFRVFSRLCSALALAPSRSALLTAQSPRLHLFNTDCHSSESRQNVLLAPR